MAISVCFALASKRPFRLLKFKASFNIEEFSMVSVSPVFALPCNLDAVQKYQNPWSRMKTSQNHSKCWIVQFLIHPRYYLFLLVFPFSRFPPLVQKL